MANYDSLINAVKAAVKTNGTGAITGATLQATLLGTIEELTVGFQFMGVATPVTTPDSNDKKEFYLGFAGTYANFGSSVTVPEGSVILFKKNDGAWSSQVVKIADPVSVQNSNKSNAKAPAISIGDTNYNITDEDAQEKTSDLISKVGYESSEETLTEDNFDGIYYGANGVIQSDSAFDGFILYVESKHIKWLSQSGLQSMRVFDEYPTIGMTTPYSDIIDLHNFVGDNVKKYILVTIRKSIF